MTTTTGKATGSFTIKAWDEQPWAEVEGAPKLTQARVTATYRRPGGRGAPPSC